MGRVILSGASKGMTAPNQISARPVGSIVKMKVNGVVTDFLIVNQGIPSNSSLYDSSCNGTWLLMKNIYTNLVWQSSNINKYESNDIRTYLSSTFPNLFESNIRDAIKLVKLPYRQNGGSGGTDQSGANGLLCKTFLLSGCEVGFTITESTEFPVDGAKLSYFEYGIGTPANNKRIANLNGSATRWWLRSPYTDNTNYVWIVNATGGFNASNASASLGIRPALILPSTTLVDSNGMVIAPPAPPVEYKANFADNDWATIIDACHNNKVPATWAVGNSKTMLIDGTEYQIDIIGKNHDDYADGSGKAPLTFQLHDCYGEPKAMNSTETNVGGWTSCDMRQTHLPAIHAKMPTEVQNGIRAVNKLTSAGSQSATINTTADKLFLLSEIEIFGSVSYSFSGEGVQYAYYKAGNSKVKNRNGGVDMWDERSPKSGSAVFFASVSSDGDADYTNSNAPHGVSFGFCF